MGRLVFVSKNIFLVSSRASKYENNMLEIMACESFVSVKFDLWPLLEGQVGHHTKTAIYLLNIGPWAWNTHHEQIKYVSFPPSSSVWKFLYLQNLVGSVYFFNQSCFLDFSKSQCCCTFSCTFGLKFLPC